MTLWEGRRVRGRSEAAARLPPYVAQEALPRDTSSSPAGPPEVGDFLSGPLRIQLWTIKPIKPLH